MNHEGQEQELLLAGHNYREVAELLGVAAGEVWRRNQRNYKVDLLSTFRKRIAENGMPSRLKVATDFGYWFRGFFDGEGSLLIYKKERGRRVQRSPKIQVMLRDDDSRVTQFIQSSLGCGKLTPVRKLLSKVKANPGILFRVQEVRDLAEVIVPLFEAYPLRSKKAREFDIWKRVVRMAYINTAGRAMKRLQSSEVYCSRIRRCIRAN